MRRSALISVVTLLSPLCLAGEADLDTVMKGYLRALGGEEKVHRITSLKKTGVYIYNGLEHPFTVWHQANRVRMDIDGLQPDATSRKPGKVVTRAYDGKTAWRIDPRDGKVERYPEESVSADLRKRAARKLLTEKHRDLPRYGDSVGTIIAEADLVSPLVDPHHQDRTLKLIGREELEGQDVHHLQVTFPDRDTQDWYLDAETFLPVKRSVPEQRRSRPQSWSFYRPQSWFFLDYRPVNGVLLPHRVEVEEGLYVQVHIFEKIEANVKVDESLFSMPES